MSPPEPVIAAIGLGSNLENPAAHVRRAFDELAALPQTRLLSCSPLYRSTAIGPSGRPADQPDFCNAAALVETRLAAQELLDALHALEAAHGRERGQRWASRTLDLDLLVYGAETIAEPGLSVPHPQIAGRNFVLFPLRDIAPDLVIPGLGRVLDLARQLDNRGLGPWQD